MTVYLGSAVAESEKKDIGVIQIVGEDYDKNILDLLDRAPDGCHMHYKATS